MAKKVFSCAHCNETYDDEYEASSCWDDHYIWEKVNKKWQCHCGQYHWREQEADDHCKEEIGSTLPTAEELEAAGQARLIP